MTNHAYIFRAYQASDAMRLDEIIAACAQADQVDPLSTLEQVPSLGELTNNSDLILAVEASSGGVVGYGTIRSWQENDGTTVYLHDGQVLPDFRDTEVGSRLLEKLEERIREIVATSNITGPKVYGANASQAQPAAQHLLETNGYKKVWSMVEMELTEVAHLPTVTLPSGYHLRIVDSDSDKRKVYNATKLIYQNTFGSTKPSESDYLEFLVDNPDSRLWKVAWVGDEVAAFVISHRDNQLAEILEVSVLPHYRRQGLASYLMVTSLKELHGQGVRVFRLHTDSEGQSGGRPLYEKLGFRALKEFYRYRKAF